jgi:aspartate beta-hydroxylase
MTYPARIDGERDMTDSGAPPPHLLAQAEEADRLARGGDLAAAARLFERVLAAAPNAARALGFFAMRALAEGDLARARSLAERAAAGWPRLALFEAQRATVLLAQGEREAALDALLAALGRDPDFAPARLDAAELLEQLGRPREAAEHYRIALPRMPPLDTLPPPLRLRCERGQALLAREQAALEATIEAHLAAVRGAYAGDELARFDECEAIFHGRKKPMLPRPGMMHFPKLAPLTFFPRGMFEWIARAEAATATVRAELQALLAAGDGGFIPYVQKDEGEAGSVWAPLNRRTEWGAYFLFNQGQRVERHCSACPRTAALLESLPLVRIPGRGPTAFFSRLRPGVRIPPHHGATNTRCIVHLPLIVPPGCALRVGNDVRAWREGEVLVFDDTIEHEAWNGSGEDRVVLIFDVWNPFLSAAERAAVTAMTAALAEFHPGQQHQTDF